MTAPELVEIWRGDFRECVHHGHVAIWHAETGLLGSFGDTAAPVLPRSSSKMIQALPMVESGAADARGLTAQHLALACASHNGAEIHSAAVTDWLSDLSLGEADLRCGPQEPSDLEARDGLICAGHAPDQRHNNCSGKHSGFLTLNRHLGGGSEYIEPDHPVQKAVLAAVEETADEAISGHAIDGCSAPNFATSLQGFARALAQFAGAHRQSGARATAMVRLREAMMQHPEMVAGEGRACTRLMRAMGGRAAIKTGAEGVFAAIVPEHQIGVALKISDGATRGAEAAMAQILVALGVLDAANPEADVYLRGPITNRRGLVTGEMRVSAELANWRL